MSLSPSPIPTLRLLLVDEDVVFRLGFRLWLNQYPDLALVAEADDGETALQILSHQFARLPDPPVSSEPPLPPVNVIVLDLSLGRANPDQIQGLNLCSQIRSHYPQLPILVLTAAAEPIVLTATRRAGATGICPKTADPSVIMAAIQQVGRGTPFGFTPAGPATPPLAAASRDLSRPDLSRPDLVRPDLAQSARSVAPLARLRRNLRQSGIGQIEAALTEVTDELRYRDLTTLNRALLAGRQRELRAARWIVSHLLATPVLDAGMGDRSSAGLSGSMPSLASGSGTARTPGVASQRIPAESVASLSDRTTTGSESADPTQIGTIVPVQSETVVDIQSAQSVTFDAVLAKMQTSLTNQTETTLEVDILREDKRRELFYLTLQKLEAMLSELRYSQVTAEQLPAKRSMILLDLWQAVLIDFFGKYYTVRQGSVEVSVVETLLNDALLVQTEILNKIPSVTDLLSHFLFQLPLVVDSMPYLPGNPAALARAELLLSNLIIQLANAVMQPLLNRFAKVEAIKQTFFSRHLLSNREIERFRNNLSWRYRVDRVFRDPQRIFESEYQLFTLTARGIQQTAIYAPRTDELEQLTGLPYVVTLALETRDAIAPRLRSAVSLVGNSLVYVLTEVIGRGIGLIGRGVLKGLGNVWQDPSKPKYGRDRQR